MVDEVITKQELIDAQKDAQSLDDFINGDDEQIVVTRLSKQYPTLANAIRQIYEKGGKFYPTLADANADIANIRTDVYVITGDNGAYYKATAGATSLTKSAYDPLTQAKDYTDLELGRIAYTYSKNKYDPSKAVTGWRISGSGSIIAAAGAKHTGYIPVEAGKQYTMSWSNTVSDIAYYSFFANSTDQSNPIGYSITGSTTSPRTFTVPTGANFVVINLKHGSAATERANFQIEEGVTATTYEPYTPTAKAQPGFLDDAVKKDELADLVEPMVDKDYEINIISKNLFNEDDLIVDRFLSTNNGGLNSSSGWLCSGFMPVEAGKTYTLSGVRARQGISFFATNVISGDPALLYDDTMSLPLTVTAPMGANYAVIALESSTAKGYSNIQFEEGNEPTEYMPYGETKKMIDPAFILDEAVSQGARNVFSLNEGSGYVKSLVDDLEVKLNVKVYNPITYTRSAVFNFDGDVVNDVTVRVNGDDTAPVRMMGATIGANHGYSRTILTLSGHGKTNADVGSVWTNGTKEYVILQIISTSQLSVTSRSDNTAFPSGGTLAHVSGATNTASFTPTNTSAAQWYPMLKNHNIYHSVDGVVSTETTGEWGFKDNVTIHESYDLMEKADIVQWLIANGAKEVKQYLAVSALNVSNIYRFNTHGGVLGATSFYTKKALSAAQDLMFTQSARLTPGVNGDIKYYVPRSVPFVHETVNYDFTNLTNVNDLGLTNRIDFTAARTESGEALPDRLIQFNDLIGYATGYLPVLDAAPDVRNSRTSKGVQISNSAAKVYPYLVDGLTTLPEGAYYSALWYRQYFKRSVEQTAKYTVESPLGDYLYLDWHTAKMDQIELPPEYAGRQFEVVRKSSNVTLLSTVATTNIVVDIDNSQPYGYLELKFD